MKNVLLALCFFFAISSMALGGEALLIPQGSTWLFLDDGSDAGTAWRQTAFDDSTWNSDAAQLGYGDGDEVSLVRCRAGMAVGASCESGGPADKFVTTYFRRDFFYRGAAGATQLRLNLLVDDGAVVYLNGQEILRVNLPAGAISFDTFSAATMNENTYIDHLTAATAFQEGSNVLAIEVHQHSRSSTDVSFDLALYADVAALPDLARGPYLMNASPDSAVVSWRTSEPAASRVELSTVPSPSSPLVFSDGALKTEHEITVDLSTLSAGPVYYAIGTTGDYLADFDPEQFIWVPQEPGNALSTHLWVIGDSGTANADAAAVRDGFRKHDRGQPIDGWLMLGDNAYDDGTDDEYQAAVFEMYPMLLRQAVLWPTLGNHDIRNADSPTQSGVYYDLFDVPTAAEAGGMPSGTEAYYSFDINNIHFISLDSADTDLADDGAMAQWLMADLNNTLQPWIIAFWHHPPYTKGSHNSDNVRDSGGRLFRVRENLLPILEAGGVDLVLTGHSHSYERSFLLNGHYDTSDTLTASMVLDDGSGRIEETGAYFKNTTGAVYAVAGSSGRISGGAHNHPAMFLSLNELGSMVLDVEGDRLDGTFLNEKGEVRDTFTLVKGTLPRLSAPPQVTVGEGGRALITVQLDQPSSVDVGLTYATAADSAEADADFLAANIDATIPAGQQSFTFEVTTLQDIIEEDPETFDVVLSNVTNAELDSAQTSVKILDDDGVEIACPGCDRISCQVRVASPQNQVVETPALSPALPDQITTPSFVVDLADASGTTTLYALRNIHSMPIDVEIRYIDVEGGTVLVEQVTVPAFATRTVNLRDIDGLPVAGDGFSRGAVIFSSTSELVGDFLQVNVGNNFATGARMPSFNEEICSDGEVRFLDFGNGTNLTLRLIDPQGRAPETDPPSFSVRVLREEGILDQVVDCHTDLQVLEINESLFTDEFFGTLDFDFSNSTSGYAFAEYSASGKFSVGVDWACSVGGAAESLYLPGFQVDTTNPSGTTTLWAVRNTSSTIVRLVVDYRTEEGTLMLRNSILELGPEESVTSNLRDVGGLVVDGDGFSRGYVEITTESGAAALEGDFFQVDVGNDFATGDRLISPEDLCQQGEIRFLDFGSGTRLRVLLTDSQGDDPGDPPSFTVTARDEDGNLLATQDRFTNKNSLTLNASDITAASFGTLTFDFTNSSGGYAYAEYSAEDRFSVGIEITCLD